jgi:2-hydroxycyclohexanecarboxyl-CoA dehydrogenase
MHGLKDKVAIVTGAARGIGAAIATRLAESGAKVALLDINESGLNDVVQGIRANGGDAKGFKFDITQSSEFAKLLDEVEHSLGPIHVLVNNAGWEKIAPFLATDSTLWDRIIDINLRGPIALTHQVLARMSPRGSGRVVSIGSDAGRVGSSGEAVYSACKGGIIALGKTLAREFAQAGITVNTVCPGPTDTPLLGEQLGHGEEAKKIYDGLKRAIPMRRLGKPQDIAGLVAFLASDEAAFITGQTISASGGLTMHG